MGWVMQELVYSLNYVLEHMDLMRSWVDIEVEKVSICVIPRPGRQRKVWKRVVDDIFEYLELDKGEWVESISKGETSIKEFLALVDESIKESNRCQFLKD